MPICICEFCVCVDTWGMYDTSINEKNPLQNKLRQTVRQKIILHDQGLFISSLQGFKASWMDAN